MGIMLVRGDPFRPPAVDLRGRDGTRSLPADSRRVVAQLASRLAPELIKPVWEDRTLPLEASYAGRPSVRLCTGVSVIPDFEDEREAAWPWAEAVDRDDFYRRYPFLRQESSTSEHFAEREFVEKVLMRTLGEAGLARVEAQVEFIDQNGGTRRIDFVLHGTRDYAIEIEGATYHAESSIGSKKFADEKLRQRSLAAAGYVYQPFAYSEVKSGGALNSFGAICDADPALRALSRLRLRTKSDDRREAADYLETTPVLLRQLHVIVLATLERGGEDCHLCVERDELGLVAVAFGDVLTLLHSVASLRNEVVELPHVRLSYGPAFDMSNSALPIYFDNPDWASDRRDNRLAALPSEALTIDDGQSGVSFSLAWPLVGLAARYAVEIDALRRTPCEYEQGDAPKQHLDTLARWFFPEVASLHPEQAAIINGVLRGGSKLVILPTAYGKSLCFQLPALIRPGLVIVICPLRALMQDQIESLCANGIAAAISLSMIDDAIAKAAKFRRLSSGSERLLYISPERMLVRTFVDEVAAHSAAWQVWALAVDEAHCVSEWGHDFRPAYLYIDKFRRRLAAHRPVVLVALTATASALVREDVLQVLAIEGPAEQLRNSDRREISFSVHAAASPEGRDETFVDVLGRRVPQALGISADMLFRDSDSPNGAVVFVPYANPHGRHTARLGVFSARRALVQSGVFSEQETAVHASRPVTVCPYCDSPIFSGPLRGPYKCADCGREFDEPVAIHEGKWLEVMAQTQSRFKRNEFPTLIATKGYGMGIDKRNIRAIVHLAYSSGLESYYQEVGRAARDQKHGHAALMHVPAADSCIAAHMRPADSPGQDFLKTIEPACVTDARSFQFWKCPHGLTSLCDFGLQARFIKGSYPGVGEDLKRILRLYDKVAGSTERSIDWWIAADEEQAGDQIAVYRLIQIGYLSEYAVDYSSYPRAKLQITRADSWSVGQGREETRVHLRKLVLQQDREAEYANIERELDGVVAAPERAAIDALLTRLLERTYRQITGMRYRMLYNEWRFANDDAGFGCRRQYLRQVFDSQLGDQPCGFCDGENCAPDLRFRTKHARTALVDATLLQLGDAIPTLIERFEPIAIQETVELAATHNALSSLQARAEHLLEAAPENQAALLLAGEAALRRGAAVDAIARLSEANAVNERTTRDRERSQLYYERARLADPSRSLDLIDQVGGLFDDPHGRAFLLQEARAALPAGHERVRALEDLVLADAVADTLPMELIRDVTSSLRELMEVA